MAEQYPFKWRHFEAEIILLCVRWYLRYALSYRDLEEMMRERGLQVDHSTIFRWVQRYAPELEKRCRPHLKECNASWKVDETSIKVKKQWIYLYRAVDSQANTLEFFLSPTRDAQAAKQFFLKTLVTSHTSEPRVMNVDKNAAYPKAFAELKAEGRISAMCELRQVKYLNNLIEQDHPLQLHLFEGRGGEAHHEAQKASSTKRVLEAKKRPVLNIQWSPRWSDQGDAVENGCESGGVPTRTCERWTDTREKP
jgi:IS6 family transposase